MFEQITDALAYHGEGPVWHESWGGLRWVDMLAGDLLTLQSDGSAIRLATGSPVAAFVRPRVDGGFVVGLERGLGLADSAFGEVRALPEMWSDPNVRMNEGGTDPWGNLYAGSMPYDKTPGAAKLYKITAAGEVDVVLPHVTTSNGIAFSPDHRHAYYNDTQTGGTDIFDVDADGALSNRRLFHDGDGGRPDGLTVDAEGCIWVALNRVGKVRRYTPDGDILDEWKLPLRLVTAVTLGGEDGKDVFVTTSREKLTDPEKCAGALFWGRSDVPGLPVTPYGG